MPQQKPDDSFFDTLQRLFRVAVEAVRPGPSSGERLPPAPDLVPRGEPPALYGIRPEDERVLKFMRARLTEELPMNVYGAVDPRHPDEILLNTILTQIKREQIGRGQSWWELARAGIEPFSSSADEQAELYHTLLHEEGHRRRGHMGRSVGEMLVKMLLGGQEYAEAEASEEVLKQLPQWEILPEKVRSAIASSAVDYKKANQGGLKARLEQFMRNLAQRPLPPYVGPPR